MSIFSSLRIGLLTLAGLMILSGCSLLSAMTPVEYNNAIVTSLNASSTTIQATANAYDKSIPVEVTELTQIDIDPLKNAWTEAEAGLNSLMEAESLESRDIEQQNAVKTALETYELAAEVYLKRYQEIIAYYETKTYVKDVNQVETLNKLIHTDYTTFIQANNSLVRTLDKFVDKEAPSAQD